MTVKQDMREGVAVPRWVITAVISLVLAFFTYTFTAGAYSKQIDVNATEIVLLKAGLDRKVNYKPEFEMIQKSLERIETKVDEGRVARK